MVYKLKRERRQLLILGEDDAIYLSKSIRSRSELDKLMDRVSDLSTDLADALGPETTVIPIAEIRNATEESSWDRVDLETDSATYRIKGWAKVPTVVSAAGVEGPGSLPAFGEAAIYDFVHRIWDRQAALGVGTPRPASEIAPGEIEALASQDRELSFLPPAGKVRFALTLVGSVLGVYFGLSYIGRSLSELPVLAILQLTVIVAVTLFEALPAPIVIGSEGMVWGRWKNKVVVPWRSVSGVEIADARFGKPRVFWVDPAGHRTPIPGTGFIGDGRIDEIRLVVGNHCKLFSKQQPVETYSLAQPSCPTPLRSKKSIIPNAATEGAINWVQVIAIPIAVFIMMSVVVLAIL